MQLEDSFEVPAAPDRVWKFMLDVERVIPCMPGAELTEVVDERTWRAKVKVKVGPVSMEYKGEVVIEERDDEAMRVMLKAKGTETRGKGLANAVVTSQLEPRGEGTYVGIVTDMTISGKAAQYGRGMIADVSGRFTKEFARNIAARLEAEVEHEAALAAAEEAAEEGEEVAPIAPPPEIAPAKPIAGIRLGLWALFRAMWRGIKRLFRFGRSD